MVAAALILLTGSAPAAATLDDRNEREARRISASYARCVVRRHRARAGEAILANLPNDVILKRYYDLVDADCMGEQVGVGLRFGGDLYRYALADALVQSEFADRGPSDFADRLPLAHLDAEAKGDYQRRIASVSSKRKRQDMEQAHAKDVSVAWLSRFGECIARSNPVGARYWVLTMPDSAEETSRIRALAPAFSNCLRGGTMKFSRSSLRGAVAINYYRLAKATVVPVSEKTN